MSHEKDDSWEMPKPVFRSSTGALPRSLEDTISHSFMPNAETIEIDEDDDILSIMNTFYRPDTSGFADRPDAGKAMEIDDPPILDIETPTELNFAEDGPEPIVVIAKSANEEVGTAPNNSESNLVVFIVVGLIVTAIIGAVLYNFFQPLTSP